MDIDKRILNDSLFLKDLSLCQLRLYKDGDLDWFLLIPRKEAVVDWNDLCIIDQIELTKEIDYVCNLIKRYASPDKINVASLGNMVPQMHVHIIARYKNDRAWPNPVWGSKSKKTFQNYMWEAWNQRLS